MTISEPSTLASDYLLGGWTAILAWRLFRQSGPSRQAARLWAWALAATAVGSFVGGTYHGFGPGLGSATASTLWTATTLTMGGASFILTAAVVVSGFSGPVRRTLLVAAAGKLAVYSWWMLGHDDFVYVICEYGSTLLIVLALVAANRLSGDSAHRPYVTGGILMSIVAAGLQQSGFDIHTHFNHNDLMHVVQMGAVWLLYQGGRRLQDASGRE